jgi:hypothetical protein
MADGSAVGCPTIVVGSPLGAAVPSTGVGITNTGGSLPPQAASIRIKASRAVAPTPRAAIDCLYLFIIYSFGPALPLGDEGGGAGTAGGY